MNVSFTASLLTIVRYSCPQVYNKSCSSLLKPFSVGEGYVYVMSECVTVCMFAVCKQSLQLVELYLICLKHSQRCVHLLRCSSTDSQYEL